MRPQDERSCTRQIPVPSLDVDGVGGAGRVLFATISAGWLSPVPPISGVRLNLRPSGYEPDELPGCSTRVKICHRLLPRGTRRTVGSMKESKRHAACRFGGDLLSHVLGRSTIGAAALNGRVRDGIGCFARASSHQTCRPHGCRIQRRRTVSAGLAVVRRHETVFKGNFGS